MINELGPNDRYVKALLKAFDSGHAKKVAAVVCRNPNASREEVELELSVSDYDDVVSFVDKLRIQESNKVSTEVKRMQEIAGIKGIPDHEQDDYEGAIVDDFTTGDWVKSKSSNVGGQVVGTNWRDNSVSVKLPNGQIQKFDANELIQDPYEDDEEDDEGTWADFKGDEKFYKESRADQMNAQFDAEDADNDDLERAAQGKGVDPDFGPWSSKRGSISIEFLKSVANKLINANVPIRFDSHWKDTMEKAGLSSTDIEALRDGNGGQAVSNSDVIELLKKLVNQGKVDSFKAGLDSPGEKLNVIDKGNRLTIGFQRNPTGTRFPDKEIAATSGRRRPNPFNKTGSFEPYGGAKEIELQEKTLEHFLQEEEDDFDLSVNPLSVDKTRSSAESYVKTLMPQIRDLVESVLYYTAQDLEEEGECKDSDSCERMAALEMSDLIEMRAIESLDDLVADEISADDGEDPLFIEVLELCTDYVSIVVQELADDYM